MYTFKTLTVAEQEEMLVNTLKAQEMDLYLHTLNKERFEDMVLTLPEGSLKAKLQIEITVIESRLVEVGTTIESLEKQMPVGIDVPAVLVRLKEKEDAYRGIPAVK